MTQKLINTGTSANKGDGDPLRLAFQKINDNFTELYTGSPIVPQDLRGSVFGDDSTLLVDGVNSNIPKANIEDSANWDTAFAWGDHSVVGYLTSVPAQTFVSLTGKPTTLAGYGITDAATSAQGALAASALQSVAFTDLTTTPTTLAGYGITDAQVAGAPYDGDITGSVFGDDSTLLVDGINNKIVGTVETSSLRTSETSITLGNNAQSEGSYSLSIGTGARSDTYGVAIGMQTQAATYDINVGAFSGKNHYTSSGAYRVAVGAFAQQNANPGDETGTGAIAIGTLAGDANQGANAVAIGRYAGRNNQAAKSIVINATDSDLENTTADSLVIKPIRNATMTTILGYDVTTGEVTHNAAIPGYTNTADLKALVAASTDFVDFQTRIAAL